MPSTWSWMNIHSPQHPSSVNSSLGSYASSLLTETSEAPQNHDLSTATAGMAQSLDIRGSNENIAPSTSATEAWVQGQTKQDLSHNAAATQRDQNVTPPPRPIPSNDAYTHQGYRSTHFSRRQPAKRIYSIETLLTLRETQSNVPVMLRVKPEAIAENIFQYMGANRLQRMSTRSRGLSEMSTNSRGSSYNHAGHPVIGSTGQTIRQPIAPPETSILQRHDGFARFLKQHASPPHHRVTAGGRIVPAGPSSPPPMFDFASLSGLVRERPPASKSAQKDGHLNQPAPRQNWLPQLPPSVTLGGYLASQGDNTTGQQVSSSNPTQVAIPYNNTGIDLQPFMTPVLQNPTAAIPIGVFPDGSTLVSYNGTNYRTYWNGLSLVMDPLNAVPLSAEPHLCTAPYPHASDNNLMCSTIQAVQVTDPLLPLTSTTNESRLHAHKPNVPSQLQAPDDEEDMKAQLSNLNKHLALNHYDITPTERTAFIAQRRHLVDEIDKIRLSKEQTKPVIPIIAPTTRTATFRVGQFESETSEKTVTAKEARNTTHRLAPTRDRQSTKCLSPAAPPFVPLSMQNSLPFNSKARFSSEQIHKLEREKSRAKNSTLNIKDVANAAMIRKEKILQAQQHKSAIALYQEKSSSSSVLDPSDPAMRVVESEDIEYAARYLYNWDHEKKAYCTTVEEFQEAIRRVREQARTYGCAGGSSKDPAYDAEQDLWWAICDRDPIPLPTKSPDHVSNPRPWNWNDSAFNYRRKGAPSPGPACEHARSSPRLSGWDPAVTESMKDIMDVSRSYYAMKGQLPSVPFRDFAYDRSGNKVKIEPEMTVPAAKFGAARVQLKLDQSPATNANKEMPLSRPTDSMALRDLTHNDVNGRHLGQPGSDRAKCIYKKNLTDGDAIRFVPSLGDKKSPKPNKSANPSHSAISGTGSQLPPHLPPPRFEDCPGTPVARHTRANSKGSPTPQRDTSSKVYQGISVNSGDGKAGNASKLVYQHGPGVHDCSGTKFDANHLWCNTRLEPVARDQSSFLEAMRPSDPHGSKLMQAQAIERLQYSPSPSRNISQNSNEGSQGSLADLEKLGSKGGDLSAQMRSQWGPEDDAQLVASLDGSGDHHNEAIANAEGSQLAKVNIPKISDDQSNHTASHTNQMKAFDVIRQKGTNAHYFLRRMLKSPPYTTAPPLKTSDLISAALKERMSRNLEAEATKDMPTGSKGNTNSSGENKSKSKSSSCDIHSNQTSPFKSLPNASVSNIQASLASSKHQAHGVLPQFGGTGNAYASALYRDSSNQLPPSSGRVSLPAREVHLNVSTPLATSTNHNIPVNLGFDGGADSPAPNKTDSSSSNQHTDPNFDYKGVTTADFEIQREGHDNAWHRGKVEDFFQELGEKEREEILAHRANARRAA